MEDSMYELMHDHAGTIAQALIAAGCFVSVVAAFVALRLSKDDE